MKNQQAQQFKEFREKLKGYRKDAGFTQFAFSEKINVGYSTLQQIELGWIPPSTKFLEKLCRATGTKQTDWVTDEEFNAFVIEQRGGSLPKGLKAQVARLNEVGKKRLELYIEANIDQLNEC